MKQSILWSGKRTGRRKAHCCLPGHARESARSFKQISFIASSKLPSHSDVSIWFWGPNKSCKQFSEALSNYCNWCSSKLSYPELTKVVQRYSFCLDYGVSPWWCSQEDHLLSTTRSEGIQASCWKQVTYTSCAHHWCLVTEQVGKSMFSCVSFGLLM